MTSERAAGLAFLFPGQGSQYVGMGRALHDAYPSARRLFEEASDLSGKDLRALCFEGPDTLLVQTDNVQPALTLVSLCCVEALRENGIEPAAVAGHSVGEYAALCAAGALTFADAIRLVTVRGAAMKAAADAHPGSMAALLGMDPVALATLCDEVARDAVQIANYNAPGQIVITGTTEGVQAVSKAAKGRGAKLVIPLRVSGAWHSRFMTSAQEPLRDALKDCTLSAPRIPVIANISAETYGQDPEHIRRALVAQIVSPVLWTQSMRSLVEKGHRVFVEAGPGKVLSGLLREVSREVTAVQVQDTDTLAKARAALDGRPA